MSKNALAIAPAATSQAALDSDGKSVTITIGSTDLETLKENGYSLCFAKKVGDHSFNVVWQSYGKQEYSVNQTFSWIPQYEIFGSNSFQDQVQVNVSTNAEAIQLGEQCTLDAAGVLLAAVPNPLGDPSSLSLTMNDNFGAIHPGVNQVFLQEDGTQTTSSIYVATEAMVQGSVTLTPVDKVLIWFDQTVTAPGTMFSNARSNSVELDLTFVPSKTATYSGGKWLA